MVVECFRKIASLVIQITNKQCSLLVKWVWELLGAVDGEGEWGLLGLL